MVAESKLAYANFGTIILLSVFSMFICARYIKNNFMEQYGGWVLFIPPTFVFTILFILYGNDAKIRRLEEKRKNDSIVWPFLFALLTIVGIGYSAIY